MSKVPQHRTGALADLRGGARLVIDGVNGVTGIVEAMHSRISRVPLPIGTLADLPTTGITGLVYRSIHGTTVTTSNAPATRSRSACPRGLGPPMRPRARATTRDSTFQPTARSSRSAGRTIGEGGAHEWLGDGLVPLASALGRHAKPTRDLHIPLSHQWIARGVNHLDLLGSEAVYRRLRRWLKP